MHMYSVPWWDQPHCITFLVSRIITSLCPGQLQNMSENVWYLRFCIWRILLNNFHFPCSLLQMAECYFLMAGFPFIRFTLILVYYVCECMCVSTEASRGRHTHAIEVTGQCEGPHVCVVNCWAHVWILFHGAYIPHFFSFLYWST